MDDYLAKPLRLKALAAMMQKWLPLPVEQPVRIEPPDSATSTKLAVWDTNTLVEVVGDQPAMHRVLLEKFLHNARAQVTAIELSVSQGALEQAADQAHALKSSARSVGALWLGELCEMLDEAGSANDAVTCGTVLQGLEQAFVDAAQAITQHLNSSRSMT